MKTIVVEIRDRATFIPALAIQLDPSNEAERYLLSRAGFGSSPERHREYIQLVRLNSGQSSYDPYDWGCRTMTNAHQFIVQNWDSLTPGAVVDVEFILGESKAPKRSEGA